MESCCRENFRSTSESGGDFGSGGCFEILGAKSFPYSVAQVAGRFHGGGAGVSHYLPAFHQVDPRTGKDGRHSSTTFPAFPAFPHAGFLDQVIGTGLLLLFIFAITDELNIPPEQTWLH